MALPHPYISIIIPVFNTEDCLSSCIESVISQSFVDFELLLIDDGSTDSCGMICDKYSLLDSRIRVFHKSNGGVSSARNLGLNHALGEWIYFVDSDDEVLPDGLQTLVNCISDEVDIVMGGYIEVKEDGEIAEVCEREVLSFSKSRSVISLYADYGSYYYYCGYLWMRLLKNRIIQDEHLCFDTSITIKEDTLFLMQYVCKSNGVTRQTTTPVYKYCRRQNSAMGTALKGFSPKYVDSFYALVRMKHEVESLYPFYSTPVFIAKQAIYRRYKIIVEMMSSDQIHDGFLINELFSLMQKEIGPILFFKIRNRIRKLLVR